MGRVQKAHESKTKSANSLWQDVFCVSDIYLFVSKPLVAFSLCKLNISDVAILQNKTSWIALASLELPLLFTVSSQSSLVPIEVTQTLTDLNQVRPCDLTFTNYRNFFPTVSLLEFNEKSFRANSYWHLYRKQSIRFIAP